MKPKTPQTTKTPPRQLVFASLGAFAGAIGISASTARQIKKLGCPGFSANGTVDACAVLRWLASGRGRRFAPNVSLEDAKARLLTARAVAVEREAALGSGRYVPLANAVLAFEKAVMLVEQTASTADVESWLLAALANNPANPLRESEIQLQLREVANRIREMIQVARQQFEKDLADVDDNSPNMIALWRGATADYRTEQRRVFDRLLADVDPASKPFVESAFRAVSTAGVQLDNRVNEIEAASQPA